MNWRVGIVQNSSRGDSILASREYSGMICEPADTGCYKMKCLIKPALFLAIVALCLFENVLHRQSSLYQEFEIALLQTQWMLLACLVVWCSTFIYLTFSLSGLPLVVLLIIAIVAFSISPPQNRPAADAFALLLGVTLGRAMRALLNQKGRMQKIGKLKAESGNFLVGLVLLIAFASFWHLNITNNFYRRLRWMGLWDNPNIYGLLMGAGLVLTIGLLAQRQKEKGKRKKFLSFILFTAAGMMAVGLVMSYSRGAWLGTAIGLLYLAKVYGKFKWRWVLPPALIALVVICFFWNNTSDSAPWYVKRMDLSRPSAQHRVAAWKAGFEIMRDHPFGVGWNKAVGVYEKDYSPPEGGAAAITTNDYLMLGTQLGIPGLLCFVAYVGLCFRKVGRASRLSSERVSASIASASPMRAGETPALLYACRAGALAMLVAFWFDGGLFKLATASVFWTLLELGSSEMGVGS
jgi:O-antigen ligase